MNIFVTKYTKDIQILVLYETDKNSLQFFHLSGLQFHKVFMPKSFIDHVNYDKYLELLKPHMDRVNGKIYYYE